MVCVHGCVQGEWEVVVAHHGERAVLNLCAFAGAVVLECRREGLSQVDVLYLPVRSRWQERA
jgi:hypothetical protein